MKIKLLKRGEEKAWDAYVQKHSESTLCHLSGWRNVIENTYGHRSYYLVAENDGPGIAGVLPLVHIKSIFFGNSLVSMPFLNYGGFLAENQQAGELLLKEAKRLCGEIGVKNIELRHIDPVSWLDAKGWESSEGPPSISQGIRKVRMLLDLPESSAKLFESFKSKLRSQIRKPQKEGLVAFIGGADLLGDFYHVFSINMRDLGSPVHAKRLFENMIIEFGDSVKLGIVKHNKIPTAAGLIFCFRDVVEIIWASSLREYNHLSPNMLLYWSILQHVTDSGYRYFDFGRSTPDEGTYKFKEQWGAKPRQLHWYNISSRDRVVNLVNANMDSDLFSFAVAMWKKIPLAAANILGPIIRKSISL